MFESISNGISEFFSNVLPHEFCFPCFLKGLGEGLVIGGLALLAIAALPELAVVGAVLGILGGVALIENWPKMSDQQKSEAFGALAGGIVAGGGGGSVAGGAAAEEGAAGIAGESAGPVNTVYRYVGPGEAQVAEETGFIPNTDQYGNPKSIYVTADEPVTSASDAESAYQIGAQNPSGPSATPTHVITGNAEGIPFDYGGNVEGGSGTELKTSQPIPVTSIRPIGGN